MFNRAFSIVELLIVVTIIGLLGVLGHNMYLSYTIRAMASEALSTLDDYQIIAMQLQEKTGSIDPYSVLFSDENLNGYLSGSLGGTSASKQVNLTYVNTITANSGTVGSDNYILLGAGLNDAYGVVSGADHVYLAALIAANGVVTWECGISASRGNTLPVEYLPKTCQNSLP